MALCACGCGQTTNSVQETNRSRGWIKGEPLRYCHGHNGTRADRHTLVPPNPGGLCMCGCGATTPVATKTSTAQGYIKGEHMRFAAASHARRGVGGFATRYSVEDRGHETPCWIWAARKNGDGYGLIQVAGRTLRAHRFLYERHIGAIPDGLVLDHLCEVTSCVNPYHLEPVTTVENMRRGREGRGENRAA